MTRYREFPSRPRLDDRPQRDEDLPNSSLTSHPSGNGETMKLISWEEIWTSLRVARMRGNREMIDVFYDTLFKEAVFDDHGAWSSRQKRY